MNNIGTNVCLLQTKIVEKVEGIGKYECEIGFENMNVKLDLKVIFFLQKMLDQLKKNQLIEKARLV